MVDVDSSHNCFLPQPSPPSFYKGWTVSQDDSHVSCPEASWSLKNKAPFLWEWRHTYSVSKPVPVNFGLFWQHKLLVPFLGPGRWGTGMGLDQPGYLEGEGGSLHLKPSPGQGQWAEVWHQTKEAADGTRLRQGPRTAFNDGKGLLDPWGTHWAPFPNLQTGIMWTTVQSFAARMWESKRLKPKPEAMSVHPLASFVEPSVRKSVLFQPTVDCRWAQCPLSSNSHQEPPALRSHPFVFPLTTCLPIYSPYARLLFV